MDVWRETSIEGHFDAISFIEPKTGLHDSDRLTLGRIQGEDQIYRLDPWRFLKTRGDVVAGYELATKATFGDEWYEENIRTVAKPLPFSPTADQRAWIRYPATSLYQLSQFCDGRTWVFMLFTFLCATARISNWQKLEFPLATIASAFYAYAISSVSLGKKDLMKNRVHETTPNSGYGSLIRSNALELAHVMTNLGSLVWALISIPLAFHSTTDASAGTDEVIMLSRAIAMLCLFLWATFLLFRYRTHAVLFEPYDYDDYDEVASHPSEQSTESSSYRMLVQSLTCLALLGFCADTLVLSVLRQEPSVQTILTLFAIPLLTRLRNQYRAIKLALKGDGNWVLDISVGAMLHTMLFVAPCLVLFGWVIKVPMSLQFSFMETMVLGLALWVLGLQVRPGVLYLLNGAIFLFLYVVATLALCLTLLKASISQSMSVSIGAYI
ncbi:MAG: hypothetical protein Q9200_004959 [Gallowayella weberi]